MKTFSSGWPGKYFQEFPEKALPYLNTCREKWVAASFLLLVFTLITSCSSSTSDSDKSIISTDLTASDILGNPEYIGICYGGYRDTTREIQPTIEEIKEDLKILSAIGIKIIRTYNTHFEFAKNTLLAIRELKNENPDFEMYVMLGAWIQCIGASGDEPDHSKGDSSFNADEIKRAVSMAREFSDIVKVIAVGNEAMVHWQTKYHVHPRVILKWVRYLQNLKDNDFLDPDIWITSSDNFASWGGGGDEYHVPELDSLIREVDFISMHTYPMHDTHYNPDFWGISENEMKLSDSVQILKAMERAVEFAIKQFSNTSAYVQNVDSTKEIHIGETGWASESEEMFGTKGSRAVDEYKAGLYYKLIRDRTGKKDISCFYFEAFDEIWKDAGNPQGSENHFGLFSVDGKAKYAVWNHLDNGDLKNLKRGKKDIVKTFNGDLKSLMRSAITPPLNKNIIQGEK